VSYDIVLLNPASRAVNHYRPPLSLMMVADWYRHRGAKVKIIDIKLHQIVRDKEFFKNINNIVKFVEDMTLRELAHLQTKEIGISCYSPEFEEVKGLIGRIKMVKNVPILVGGIHPTLRPGDFRGLAVPIVGRRDVKTVAYDLVDMEYYSTANPYAIRGVYLRCAYIITSIGCPGQCTFCVAKTLRKHLGIERLQTPAELVKTIYELKKNYKIDGVYIIDDLFTTSSSYLLEFCMRMQDSRLLWGCNSKVNTLDEKKIKTMSEAGCIQIDFGVERGNNEALQRLCKGITIEQVREVFNLCRRYKVRSFANFLCNIPGETPRDWADIVGLLRGIRPEVVSVNVFRGYLGTELDDQEPSREVIQFARDTTKRFNSLWRGIHFHLSWRYIKRLLGSKRKRNYLKQLWQLLKEIANQKLS
jgi:radical SAM superfamily enzyme YgiQ (UPF0313 family)